MTYEEQLKIEQQNKEILSSVDGEALIEFYKTHNRKETKEKFGIRTDKQLVKALTMFGYDFSIKKALNKGKPSARSHESYVEAGKKSSATQQKHWEEKSEEEKKAWSDLQIAAHSSEETRQKISLANQRYQASLTAEQKEEIRQQKRSINRSVWAERGEEIIAKSRQTCLEKYGVPNFAQSDEYKNIISSEENLQQHAARNIDVAYYLNLIKNTPFPFPQYSEKTLKRSYKELQKRTILQSNTGLDIVKHFHPSIWRCNIAGHVSPVAAWHDDLTMMRVIINRAKYLNTDTLSPQNLITGLSVTKLAPKVSIFRPMTAKYLINKYLSDYKTIFDPCAGFSGRMLGTCVLGKHYIGQDINSTTIREAKELRDYFKLDAELQVKDSLYDVGGYEALFTCPPYGDKEGWYQDIEVLSADEWITTCLKNYKCKAYLFVVDKTALYKDFVVETISNKSHFGSSFEQVILIQNQ